MLYATTIVKNFLNFSSITIDNLVFQIHYKITAIILLLCALLVSSRTILGEPMQCLGNRAINPNVLNTYCLIHSTFSVNGPRASIGRLDKKDAFQGVSPYVKDEDDITTHKYYQWVGFILLFQALCFYVPRYLWQICEDHHIKMLVVELNSAPINKALRTNHKTLLVEYFNEHLHEHTLYMFQYILCELLNLVNVIGQIYLLTLFLGNRFIEYGLDVLGYSGLGEEMRVDPMARMFPTMAKCLFNKYGPSGSIQAFDGLCLLPLNIFNEKIFVFLWFWFCIVACVSIASIVYRMAVVTCPYLRIWVLCARTNMLVSTDNVRVVCRKLGAADWFVLNLLGKNIDAKLLKEIITDLSRCLDTKDSSIQLSELKSE